MSELDTLGVLGYLEQHKNKSLLRVLACGSVDDGKSTLIGRLLHDSLQLYDDQLAALRSDQKGVNAEGDLELAMLVDGLQAEREQGITIDVAYRYFSTTARKFILVDSPGHEQYTRNMVTGASHADIAILLIDARYGVQVQTRRHATICSLLIKWTLWTGVSNALEKSKRMSKSLRCGSVSPMPPYSRSARSRATML